MDHTVHFYEHAFFLRSAFFSLPIHGIGKLGSEGLEKKTHRRNRRKLFTDLILILATYVHIYRLNFNFSYICTYLQIFF